MKILTKAGFKPFDGVKQSKKTNGIKFELDNGDSLTCTLQTRIEINGNWVYARQLKIGDKINNIKIKTITPICTTYYDIINVLDEASFIVNKSFNVHNCAFISNYAEFENAIIPTISSSKNSKIIMTSTPCGLNHWYDLWMNAEEGKSSFKNTKVEWWQVPGRDESWKETMIKTLKGGARAFAQEYACEFLGSSDTLIDIETLMSMKAKDILYTKDNFKIYKEPNPNNNYIMLCDPARGGGDNFAVHIIDVTNMPFEQVASATFNEYYLKLPIKLLDILHMYNDALLIMENNDASGLAVVDILWNIYEYENIYSEKYRVRGVRTTRATRDKNLNLMKWCLENKRLVLHDKDTIDELTTFINNNGRYEAQSGKHDDLVMSLSLLFFIFKDVRKLSDYTSFIENKHEEEQEQNEFIELLKCAYFDRK